MADQRPSEPLTSELLTNVAFRTSLRGYDATQVRAFLATVDEHVRALRAHNEDLQRRLRDAEDRVANPVLDESQKAALLGDETSRILRSANEAAAEIRSHAEEHVERVVQQARDDSARLTAEASSILEVRRAAAEAEAAEILRAANAEAARLVADATAAATEALTTAQAEATATVENAKNERNETLSDVRKRRRLANIQVEQLRAGRERLLKAYEVVRSTLDEVTSELNIAEHEAKAAADSVGRRMAAAIDPLQADSLASAPFLDTPPPPPKPAIGVPTERKPQPSDTSSPEEVPGRPHRKGKKGARPPVQPEPAPPVPTAAAPEPPRDPNKPKIGDTRPAAPPPAPPVEVKVEEPKAEEPTPEPKPKPEPEPKQDTAAATTELFDRIRAEQPAAPSVASERARARNAACGGLEEVLVRRLKRQLQDEQNVVLDRMRSKRGAVSADVALGTEAEHFGRYVEIVAPALTRAAEAGAKAAGAKAVGADVAAVVANDFAMELVLPIRRRLDESLHEAVVGGDDQGATSDRVSAAYREAKTQRVARLTTEWLVAAWSVGVHAAAEPGAPANWAQDPEHPCCSDCDDNSLAGVVPVGAAFPTGHLHPPAHPGCRCVVVPAT